MFGRSQLALGLAASGVLLICGGAASAEDKGKAIDNHFAAKAAQGGMAEVKLGQLAQDKGSSDSVKQFGKKMVEDHSKANDQLKSVAAKENITLPADVDAKDQAIYDRLSKLSGADFDRAYARDMVRDHKQDIAEFQKEANKGKDDAIKNFASQTLPTLQEHLKMAQGLISGSSSK
ncbi:MAG: DUF4142 domain-containing protein [Acidobacteriota bacterium]|nr:DUF4142 domain-containing protein [Acidobacteriota bacterium]